ncbi:ras gtpase-activating protein [Anaeramoeba ignava]|uniref:Ras gtpase-activating protein n=1 Tax=Anaeramoeba ignava TaxID=1746090 RepID=A0A9Q0R913_ANAIG|nr:ras gtpase-activating protein [Anaeramoeba ignava]
MSQKSNLNEIEKTKQIPLISPIKYSSEPNNEQSESSEYESTQSTQHFRNVLQETEKEFQQKKSELENILKESSFYKDNPDKSNKDMISLLDFSQTTNEIIYEYQEFQKNLITLFHLFDNLYFAGQPQLAKFSQQLLRVDSKHSRKEKKINNILLKTLLKQFQPDQLQTHTISKITDLIMNINLENSKINLVFKDFMDILSNEKIKLTMNDPLFININGIFDHIFLSVLFKKELASQLITKLSSIGIIDIKLDEKRKFEILQNSILKKFDKFILGIINFPKAIQAIQTILITFQIEDTEKLAMEIFTLAKKKALGKILVNLIKRVLSPQLLQEIKKQKEILMSQKDIHIEIDIRKEELRQDEIDHLVYQKSVSILQEHLKEKDICFIIAAITGKIDIDASNAFSFMFFNLLEPLSLLIPFIKATISVKVAMYSSDSALFRSNEIAESLISKYLKIYAEDHLKKIIEPFINDVCQAKKTFEINPNSLSENEDLSENIENVKIFFQDLLNRIMESIPTFPNRLKIIFAHLRQEILHKSDYLSLMGSFFFLRHVCPALISPAFIHDGSYQLTPSERSGLKYLSIAIQTLSSGLTFSARQSHLQPLNYAIINRFEDRKVFLESICVIPKGYEEKEIVPDYKLLNPLFPFNLLRKRGKYTLEQFAIRMKFIFHSYLKGGEAFLPEFEIFGILKSIKRWKFFLKENSYLAHNFHKIAILCSDIYHAETKSKILDEEKIDQSSQLQTSKSIDSSKSNNDLKKANSNIDEKVKKTKSSAKTKNEKNTAEKRNRSKSFAHRFKRNKSFSGKTLPVLDEKLLNLWTKNSKVSPAKEAILMHKSTQGIDWKKRYVCMKLNIIAVFNERFDPNPIQIVLVDSGTLISLASHEEYKKKNAFLISRKGDNSNDAIFACDLSKETTQWINDLKLIRKNF